MVLARVHVIIRGKIITAKPISRKKGVNKKIQWTIIYIIYSIAGKLSSRNVFFSQPWNISISLSCIYSSLFADCSAMVLAPPNPQLGHYRGLPECSLHCQLHLTSLTKHPLPSDSNLWISSFKFSKGNLMAKLYYGLVPFGLGVQFWSISCNLGVGKESYVMQKCPCS